jgi:hypothetical protein
MLLKYKILFSGPLFGFVMVLKYKIWDAPTQCLFIGKK